MYIKRYTIILLTIYRHIDTADESTRVLYFVIVIVIPHFVMVSTKYNIHTRIPIYIVSTRYTVVFLTIFFKRIIRLFLHHKLSITNFAD